MKTFCHAFNDNLFLVGQPTTTSATAKKVDTDLPTDIVEIVDVSGSMASDLPQLLRELGNMLPRFLRSGDTFSLIFFSGPNQAGLLLDRAKISAGGARAMDIANIQKTLATLDVIGMTCFTDPLTIAGKLGEVLKQERPGATRTLIMATDGYDNTSPGFNATERRKNIFKALTDASGSFDRSVFIGVGWYCDQNILQDMAASVGGQFLFARDINTFNREFEVTAAKRVAGTRRVELQLAGKPVEGLAFTVDAIGDITQYAVEDGAVSVDESAGTVWYLSDTKPDVLRSFSVSAAGFAQAVNGEDTTSLAAAYAALALFSQRARRKLVRAIAGGLGDRRFLDLALGAFGPQRYNALADEALMAVKGQGRFINGFVNDLPTNPKAFTVLDAIYALASGKNRVVPDFAGWKYTPMTRGRVATGSVVTAADVEQVEKLAAGLESQVINCMSVIAGEDSSALLRTKAALLTGSSMIAEAINKVTELHVAKPAHAKYKYVPAPKGYPVDGLVFASEEANVSIRIKRDITVDLTAASATLPNNLRDKIHTEIGTYKYQTHNIIAGRVLHQATYPVILDEETWNLYKRAGLVSGEHSTEPVIVDFSKLPLINDSMIDTASAVEVVQKAYDLEVAKGALKVLNNIKKLYLAKPESSAVETWVAFNGLCGEDAEVVEKWLADLGIGDDGYAPHTTQAKVKDQRRSWLLDIKIPGLSSLPSMNDVRKKLDKIASWKLAPKGKEPKLTAGEQLLAPTIAEFDAFLKVNGFVEAKLVTMPNIDKLKLSTWLDGKFAALKPVRKGLLFDLGKAAIVAITGGEWFADLKPGEKEVQVAGLKCTADIVDVDIDI